MLSSNVLRSFTKFGLRVQPLTGSSASASVPVSPLPSFSLSHLDWPSSPFGCSTRWIHSHRQIKKIFNNNPARRRVLLKKHGKDHLKQHPLPEAQLSPIVEDPHVYANGWSKQAESRPDYPFTISRTQNKPKDTLGFLPIYSKYRKDGTKVVTIVKRIKGDVEFLMKEIRAVLELPEPKNPRYNNIRVRVGGAIEIDGNHSRTLKQWFTGLGF